MNPVFLLISGPDYTGNVELQVGKTYRIGRLTSCEIVLRDRLISRKQAMIQSSEAGEFYVVDLGSRNGTSLNGTRLSAPAAVKDGDAIGVGEHTLTFRGPAHAPAPTDDSTSGTQVLFVRRMVSVLVVDIRGYTAMSRRIDPELLAQAVGNWFRDAGRVLQQHGCWSVKYIGDAVMAVWLHGEESEKQREVLRLLEGAAEFIQSTARVQGQFEGSLPFQVGVGINTGMAVVGNAGTKTYTDYTAMGDIVNATFRMESCTREIQLQFAIGPATLKMLEPFCDASRFLLSGTVALKGYEEPMTIWAGSLADIVDLIAAVREQLSDPA